MTETATTAPRRQLIVAVDPGKATGVATWDTGADGGDFDSFELQPGPFFEWLRVTAAACSRDRVEMHLVSESFTITSQTGKNSQAGWSLELIGAMKYVIAEYAFPELVLQSPAVGKSFGTDSKLRFMGMWRTGLAGHANDASRHLVTFMATRAKVLSTATLKRLATL